MASVRSCVAARHPSWASRFSASAVVVGSLCVGCLDAVSLGSACPGRVQRCDQVVAPASDANDPLRDAALSSQDLDGAVVGVPSDSALGDSADAAGRDASVPSGDAASLLDASVVSTVAFPALRNGSFELTRGGPGELAYSPIDPVPLGSNLIEPWGACRTGYSALEQAEAVSGLSIQDVRPTDGDDLVQAELAGIGSTSGLRQTLATPMRGGTRYGFAIDLRASVGAQLSLQVSASQVDCVQGVKLAESGPVSDQAWQRVCISFTPLIDTPQLMLQPVALAFDGSGRLFVDNLRDDPSCRY